MKLLGYIVAEGYLPADALAESEYTGVGYARRVCEKIMNAGKPFNTNAVKAALEKLYVGEFDGESYVSYWDTLVGNADEAIQEDDFTNDDLPMVL